MGFFDLFKKKKTDDEIELESVVKNAVHTVPLESTKEKVIALLREDSKLLAIKYVKDNTGVGLKEAKDYVEHIEVSLPALIDNQESVPSNSFANSDDVENMVKEYLRNGQKIHAVKYVKDTMVIGLKEAKDYVDNIEAQGNY